MKERSTGLVDRGYPVVEATLYIYCDVCGSFNIKTYIPFIKLLITAVIITIGILFVVNDRQWLMCLLPLGLLALYLPWRTMLLRYKCRKYGYGCFAFHAVHLVSDYGKIISKAEQWDPKQAILIVNIIGKSMMTLPHTTMALIVLRLPSVANVVLDKNIAVQTA